MTFGNQSNTNNPNGSALAVNGVITATSFNGNGAGISGVSLAGLNAGGALAWPGQFVVTASPSVGTSPTSVTAADVNGDGKSDLISANSGSDSLTVLTNNGFGGFLLSSSLPTLGSQPWSVTTADVNSDGRLDLISANRVGNSLSVFTNTGNGGFVLSSTPGVGTRPFSVKAADVNGDGKVDLISANLIGSTLTVLTNEGTGSYVLASSPSVGVGPYSVEASDVNGDGRPDLISANYGNANGNTLTVLTNDGGGSFVIHSSPEVGMGPVSVVAADVNGDAKVDLISADQVMGTLTVLTNNGSGGFVVSSSLVGGIEPFSVTTADVTGDGKVDLISANRFSRTLSVFTNNGSGGFALASSPSVGIDPVSVTAADVNGDGMPDLISANFNSNTLTVLFNTPTFKGNFIGNGSGLTSLADTALSPNVALRAGGNAFSGDQTIAGTSVLEFGAGLVKELNAGKIGYQTFTPNTLDIVGAGTSGLNRKIKLWAEGGITMNGSLGIGTATPQATLDVAGSFRVNGGSTFNRVQDGFFDIGTNPGGISKVVTNNFPTAFSTLPTVTATAINQVGFDVPDTFVVTVRRVTTTQVVFNIVRVDANAGWAQNLRIAYHAWE